MKNIFKIAASALVILSMASCVKFESGDTRTTYYADITLDGGSVYVHERGEAFVDPGYNAVLNGEDVNASVVITSNVDVNASGIYSINYSVTNPDGFTSSVTRTVVVMSSTDPVEGFYTVDGATSNRNGAPGYYDGNQVIVLCTDPATGVYNLSCGLGGYYEQGRGYGSAYAADTYIEMSADNTTFTYVDSYVAGWGDSIESMEDCVFDAATGTMSWTANYAGMAFHVEMTK